ncbi:MAG: threonylcarbamoyl-AMP synthase [Holosporaceae bacterium]|nr:threonylcarbamoyl-AMP synthase [Holosporaceae bacterium]
MHEILLASEKSIEYAANTLMRGGLVVFPTETVYGLGGNACDDHAVTQIFSYKGRPHTKALGVCYASLDDARVDVEVNELAYALAKKFLPGPLTLILKRLSDSRLSALCSAGKETVGVRIPSNETALKLLAMLSFPLAAPSANKSTSPSPVTAAQASESLKDNEDLVVLDDGACPIGIESTIVDVLNKKIIRLSAIKEDEINSVFQEY